MTKVIVRAYVKYFVILLLAVPQCTCIFWHATSSRLLSVLEMPQDILGGQAGRISISGNYIYYPNGDGLNIINIENAGKPVLIDTMDLFELRDVDSYNDYLFMTSNDGLHIYDISEDPTAPVEINSIDDLELNYYCVYNGYIFSRNSIDVNSEPLPSTAVKAYRIDNLINHVSIEGTPLIPDFEIKIEAENWRSNECYECGDTVKRVQVDDNRIYTTAAGRFLIIDRNDFSLAASLVFEGLGVLGAFNVTEDRIYLQTGYKLHVIDITDRHSPLSISTIDLGFTPSEVALSISGQYLLFFSSPSIYVFDITDPTALSLVDILSVRVFNGNHVLLRDDVAILKTGENIAVVFLAPFN